MPAPNRPRRPPAPVLSASAIASASAIVLGLGLGPAAAADLGRALPPAASDGIPCDAPEVQSFPDVLLGHFTGGASAYAGPGSSILLDWRDEKLCFPSRRSCNRWIGQMRRDFHHPAGDYTCLTIR